MHSDNSYDASWFTPAKPEGASAIWLHQKFAAGKWPCEPTAHRMDEMIRVETLA